MTFLYQQIQTFLLMECWSTVNESTSNKHNILMGCLTHSHELYTKPPEITLKTEQITILLGCSMVMGLYQLVMYQTPGDIILSDMFLEMYMYTVQIQIRKWIMNLESVSVLK